MKQTIRSRRVVTAAGIRPACVSIEDGRFSSVDDYSTNPSSGTELIDVQDLFVLPGLVDTHVHINDPGRSEWEGFRTGTRAAAAGGCTSIIDMPLNAIPPTTSVSALEAKREAAQGSCAVDYAFWGGVVPGNEGQLQPLASAGVRGFKCFLIDSGVEEFPPVTEADLEEAMPLIAKTELPLLVHAELPGPIARMRDDASDEPVDWSDYGTYLRSRPDDAEVEAIELMIKLGRKHSCRIHIVHLSSAQALPQLRKARAQNVPFSVETCPHYLYFAAERIPGKATQYKCAPPIRDLANQELLWAALQTGSIDMIATDHSPCPPELKQFTTGDFAKAWGGIASLSLTLPVVWTAAKQHGFEITDVVRWMCQRTAELAGLQSRKGRIAPGYDADLVVFDPNRKYEVTTSRLHSRHPVSPYLGERLEGEVKMTFVRGNRVFDNGQFADERPGIELRVQ